MADDTMTDQPVERRQVEDVEAIRQTALDYLQGWYEGDAERMRQSLHSELAKRAILRDIQSGEERFYSLNQQQMVEKTRQGGGTDTPSDKRYYDVSVLDVYGDIASVRANSYDYVDYLHLARSGGRWVIVNALWADNHTKR